MLFDSGTLRDVMLFFGEKEGKWLLISPYAVVCLGLLLLAYSWYRQHGDSADRLPVRERFSSEILLAMSLIVICVLFIFMTKNDRENGMAYVFVALGIVHNASLKMFSAKRERGGSAARGSAGNIVVLSVSGLLLAIALRDACLFNREVNASRSVHEMRFTSEDASRTATLPRELAFMVFKAPGVYPLTGSDLTAVAELIRNSPNNFLLIGDTSILYGITGKPSVAPSLWFHPALTLPPVDTEAFRSYEERLMQNMVKYHVREVIMESSWTGMGTKLGDFPRLRALVDGGTCSYRSIGLFVIYELCPDGSGRDQKRRLSAGTETRDPAVR
jgi:hypothetical protein